MRIGRARDAGAELVGWRGFLETRIYVEGKERDTSLFAKARST